MHLRGTGSVKNRRIRNVLASTGSARELESTCTWEMSQIDATTSLCFR